MKKRIFMFITICTILLNSCGSSPEIQPPITTTSIPPTATLPPTLTSTPEPTFTPTVTPTPKLPVISGTQIPLAASALSADNIDQIVELARWGNGVITDAVFSPDGKLVAVATTLGVSVYETDTMNEILYLETDAGVNSVIFSPDGKTIATSLSDNTLKVWNGMDGTLIMNLVCHSDQNPRKEAGKPEVTSIAFSPDGSELAGGSTDGTVCLWRISDSTLINTFRNHTERISSVFFSPDGKELFSSSLGGKVQSSGGGKVQMVNVVDGKLIRTFLGVSIIDASISNDGKILATYDTYYYYQDGISHTEDKLILWDVESGEKLEDLMSRGFFGDNTTTNLAFSPNGQFIAAAFQDRTVKIWDVANGELKYTLDDLVPKSWYYLDNFTLSFSPDSRFLLMAGANVIGVWNIENGTLINNSIIKSEELVDIALSPDGRTLASIEGPNIKLWQFSDGNSLSSAEPMKSNGSLNFSPDGATLLASMFGGGVQLIPLSEQGIKKSIETENPYSTVAFSPDGKRLALGTIGTGEVELRNVSDGSILNTFFVDRYAYIMSVRFSPDGKYLAATTSKRIRLFQVSDGSILQTFNRGPSVAFSPDGALLAEGSTDKTISVWDVQKSSPRFTIKDRQDEVRVVSFSPDGQFLAAGYLDGTIEVFQASDGTSLKSWNGHSRAISNLIFTPDGNLLISSSWDGTIRIWGLKP